VAAVATFLITRVIVGGFSEEPPPIAIEQPAPDTPPQVVFDPPTLNGPPRPPGVWEWVELRGGECLGTPPTLESADLTVVPCDGDHRARYLEPFLVSVDEDAPYPGDEALATLADDHCRALTAADVGVGPEVDDLVVTGLYLPDEMSWQAGHRVVGCVVFRAGGENLPGAQPALEE
jgi:hypothetical protein